MKDRLTNHDISTQYQKHTFWLVKSDFMAAFAYWVVAQHHEHHPDITAPLRAYYDYVSTLFEGNLPLKFTYSRLENVIRESCFGEIPEILELNKGDDFIDLGALARNVRYMILRESITCGTVEEPS